MGNVTWRKRPSIIRSVGFDFHWDVRKVWRLDVPVTEMDIKKLVWHFDIPFWEKDGTDDWNLTPREVLNKCPGTSDHQKRTRSVTLKYPIDIMRNKGRWVVLDGLHRLVKAYRLGRKKVKVRIIPQDKIETIRKATKKLRN